MTTHGDEPGPAVEGIETGEAGPPAGPDDHPTSEAGRPVDFTAITGVGSVTSAALNQAGISSMAVLAAMTVGQVSRALEEVGVQISSNKIISQLWLQQAWMLSSDDEDAGSPPAPDHQSGAGIEHEADAAEDWHEQFGLFVYVDRSPDGRWRTRIYDTTNLIEERLPGVAPGLLVDRIIERIGSTASS